MKTNSFSTIIALTAVSIIYGANYSILKIAIPEYMGPLGLTVYRVSISALVFWCMYLFNREKINWKEDGIRFFLCALSGTAINMLLFFKGISLTSAVNGSIIMTLTPILVLLWAVLLLGEKVTRLQTAGTLIGLLGALIIIYNPNTSLSEGNWTGDLLILGNAISYACYLVLAKTLMKKYNPITVATWVFTIGIPLVVPAGFHEASQIDFMSLPLKVWLSIGYVIFLCTVLVTILNIGAMRKVSPSVVGSFIYLQPVFATFTAILFFDEVFLLKHFLAAFFVFGGVWLVTKKSA